MTRKKKDLEMKEWIVSGDYWGFEYRVRARTEGEAKDKVRKMKKRPQIADIYADECY